MITTIAKMVPISVIIIFGLFWGKENAIGQTVTQIGHTGGGFGVAILATLFAYDGWILIANLGGEVKEPQKVLPQAIIMGISLVLIIYTLITIGFLRFLPVNVIHHTGENTAMYLASKVFGKFGGKLLSAGVIISMLGTLNGKMLTFPRIAYAMARRRDLPFSRYLAYTTPKAKSPVVATLFIIFIATIMMFFFDPDHLSDLCISTIYFFYLLTFVGIFILRKKNPDKWPFSTPLYPLVPIIAIAGGLFILISELLNDFGGVLLFAGMVIVGLPIFYAVRRMDKKRLK